ncbi:TrkA family potassium uptake protein [Sorangium sp. So ce327]|jgi:trk system potassium uptake protein TrkA|uniref:potassium channel family protein n=1 Tax=Sorangium sp. So ce327 TaxID=3133301 RepID=UPI003F5DDCA4
MRVLIAGAGRAGLSVAVHLAKMGHDVTTVDRDEAIANSAFERHGLVSLVGDATDAGLLQEAEVARADVVVAMLRRDADNLAVALLAQAGGAKRVMVRMRDPAYRGVYIRAGVDQILSEIDVFIGAMATAIEHPGVRHAMVLGAGESVAFELDVPVDSVIAGRTVSTIAGSASFPSSCVFAGVYRPDGRVEAPRGSSVVAGGATVLLVAARDELAEVIAFFLRREPASGGAHERR